MTRQSCTPSARGASLGLLRERQADSDHGCHQWHWLGGSRSAGRPRREPRHRRSQQDENPHCVGSYQGGGREGSDGGDSSPTSRRRPRCAGWPPRCWPATQSWMCSSTTPRDARNTAADKGRHRTDVGGQPPGAVSAHIWPDGAPAHLIDIAIFCDSDETRGHTVSYFADVKLRR